MMTEDDSKVNHDGTHGLKIPVKLGSLDMVIDDLVLWYPELGWRRGHALWGRWYQAKLLQIWP